MLQECLRACQESIEQVIRTSLNKLISENQSDSSALIESPVKTNHPVMEQSTTPTDVRDINLMTVDEENSFLADWIWRHESWWRSLHHETASDLRDVISTCRFFFFCKKQEAALPAVVASFGEKKKIIVTVASSSPSCPLCRHRRSFKSYQPTTSRCYLSRRQPSNWSLSSIIDRVSASKTDSVTWSLRDVVIWCGVVVFYRCTFSYLIGTFYSFLFWSAAQVEAKATGLAHLHVVWKAVISMA